MRELSGDTVIRLSQIDWTPYVAMVFDKHSAYQPGDRAVWKTGIYEKTHHGWKKVGTSHPMKVIGKDKQVYNFNINKNNFEENKKKLCKRVIVSIPSGSFTGATGKEATVKAQTWVTNNIKEPIQTEIGKVEVDKNTIKNTLNHKRYPTKYDTIVALKPLLQHGFYLGNMKDLDGEGDLNNHYFAGKVKIDGQEKYLFCRVKESIGQGSKRFYVHSVFSEDDLKNKEPPSKAGVDLSNQLSRGDSLYVMLMQNFLNCK